MFLLWLLGISCLETCHIMMPETTDFTSVKAQIISKCVNPQDGGNAAPYCHLQMLTENYWVQMDL